MNTSKCTLCVGPFVVSHLQKDCVLQKASFCSYCGTGGHFTINCKYHKTQSTEDRTEKIPSVSSIKPRPGIRITKDVKSVRAFLHFHKLSVAQDLTKNVKAVETFCKKQSLQVHWVEIPKETHVEKMFVSEGV